MTPEQVTQDVAARIRLFDREAADSAAAFLAGRFAEYWKRKTDRIMKSVEVSVDASIAAADLDEGNAKTAGSTSRGMAEDPGDSGANI
jgi:hypothetical protein